jgi:hypothetical protein
VSGAQDATAALQKQLVAQAFEHSRFVADKLAVPADLLEARFGASFKPENGRLVAYDATGNAIMRRDNPGEPAEFDEALERLVAAHPQREAIMRGLGNAAGPSKTMPRAIFDTMPPRDRMAHIKAGGLVHD